jgi:nicotinate-nucleotide--dimethylbenzimidazole phosphoribosyltransferase
MSDIPGSLDEIRAILEHLPDADHDAGAAAGARQKNLTKPAGSLGRLEELALWLARWQGRERPRAERLSCAVFAANHGIAARGVSAYPAEVTAQMVKNFIDGGAAVNQLCKTVGADLRVYELGLEEPTADFTAKPAMSEEDCVRAIAYGMTAVQDDLDLIALGEMGIANTTSAAALCFALYGGEARDWCGRGTGIDDQRLAHKTKLVAEAAARHKGNCRDGLDLLRCLGGLELAAIVGAVIAARMARTAVLLDGYVCTAAAASLADLLPGALAHCQVAHVSAEPGHRRLLERLEMRALLDFDMRLGEASGAVLALPLLKAACACHNDMATFAEAAVSGPAD